MSHSSRVSLTSVASILTEEHVHIPRPPAVIIFAAAFLPIIIVHPPEDLAEQTDFNDVDGPLNVESRMLESRVHSVTSDEDDEDMELAESIYEAPVVEQERSVLVEFIEEKMSKVLFSFRCLLCVDLLHTCFPGVTRQ